jgi:hypothetical protein
MPGLGRTRDRLTGGELSVEQIIDTAQQVEDRIANNLPGEAALRDVAHAVTDAARLAQVRVRRLKRPYSVQRIRQYVVLAAAAMLFWWLYTNVFGSRVATIAVTGTEYSVLKARADANNADKIRFLESAGSSASVELVRQGQADMAVVQAGVAIPEGFTILGVVRAEHVLYFTRDVQRATAGVPRVMTFGAGQGSHILGQLFFELWGHERVEWLYTWGELAADVGYVIPLDVEAIFVVVDPADRAMRGAIRRAAMAGFELRDPDIGVYATHFTYLERVGIPRGHYSQADPTIPDIASGPMQTYAVANYLMAGEGVTDRQLGLALQAFELDPSTVGLGTAVLHSRGSSLVADLGTVLEAAVNLVIILVALFGFEILLHRRYVHELNRLISCISLLQANLDVIGVKDEKVLADNVFYLDTCADLLGLISTIGGYYGQENAALVFNGLTGLLHVRANNIKVNIRLKLLRPEVTMLDTAGGAAPTPDTRTASRHDVGVGD